MKQSVVKISVTSPADYNHIDDVVYYRSGMTPDFLVRWLWYYEYLAARIKVDNPRRRVVLYHGPVDIMLGDEWHEYRRQSLLKSRAAKLKQLHRSVPDCDLFGFGQAEHEQRVNEVECQIAQLEADAFPIPEFPTYINKLKEYIN